MRKSPILRSFAPTDARARNFYTLLTENKRFRSVLLFLETFFYLWGLGLPPNLPNVDANFDRKAVRDQNIRTQNTIHLTISQGEQTNSCSSSNMSSIRKHKACGALVANSLLRVPSLYCHIRQLNTGRSEKKEQMTVHKVVTWINVKSTPLQMCSGILSLLLHSSGASYYPGNRFQESGGEGQCKNGPFTSRGGSVIRFPIG